MTVTYSGGQYIWKETNEILTGGFYVHLDDVELTKAVHVRSVNALLISFSVSKPIINSLEKLLTLKQKTVKKEP